MQNRKSQGAPAARKSKGVGGGGTGEEARQIQMQNRKSQGAAAAARKSKGVGGGGGAGEEGGGAMPQEQHQAAAAQERKAVASAGGEGRGVGSVFTGAPTSLGCFPNPHPYYTQGAAGSPMNSWTHPQSTDPPTWDNNPHPPGGFLSFFNNQLQMSQNFHLVGGSSHCAPFKAPRPVDIGGSSPPLVTTPTSQPDQVPIDVDSGDEVGRTEKRILWTQEEDVRLMSSWLENSTDSAAGADRKNDQYWGDVAKTYNMTTPAHRRRNPKQAKDRWHKINKWTDLFQCAWVKARRIYTSGYSDQQWIDMAHKFYVEDNKELKLGHFVLMDVWYVCRDQPKWVIYNDELKKARKRKASGQKDVMEDIEPRDPVECPRPMGQKKAKKAAFEAKKEGKSKETAIDVENLDKFSKIQTEAHTNRLKVLEVQQKLSTEKLKHQDLPILQQWRIKKLEMEAKMMETYNCLLSQDTGGFSAEEKDEHVAALKCLRKRLFLN